MLKEGKVIFLYFLTDVHVIFATVFTSELLHYM